MLYFGQCQKYLNSSNLKSCRREEINDKKYKKGSLTLFFDFLKKSYCSLLFIITT